MAVAQQESNFNYNATGALGEIGLFQLRPQYVKRYSKKELYDPMINIRVGIERLAQTKVRFKKTKDNGWLAAYNCGETKAKQFKFPEKFKYVVEINKRIASMR